MATARSGTGFFITQRSRRYSPRNGAPPTGRGAVWPSSATRARHTSGPPFGAAARTHPGCLGSPGGPGPPAPGQRHLAATRGGSQPAPTWLRRWPSPKASQVAGVPRRPARHRAAGGSGGIPREKTASHGEAGHRAGEDRATPGGYGGKPPGVAFIGVPTGARNAGTVLQRGTRAPTIMLHRTSPLCVKTGLRVNLAMRGG